MVWCDPFQLVPIAHRRTNALRGGGANERGMALGIFPRGGVHTSLALLISPFDVAGLHTQPLLGLTTYMIQYVLRTWVRLPTELRMMASFVGLRHISRNHQHDLSA